MMKALFAALALVTLLASPTFAQTANSPTCGGYGWGPSSPCYGSHPKPGLGEDVPFKPRRWFDIPPAQCRPPNEKSCAGGGEDVRSGTDHDQRSPPAPGLRS